MSKKGILLPEIIPDFLTSFPDIIERIESLLRDGSIKGKEKMGLDINQVLVNEYLPGQGISPHEDGPAFRPLVATLSLGYHTILDIHHYLNPTKPSPPMTSQVESDTESGKTIAAIPLAHLLLMPRSLLILKSSLYTSHLHSISSKEEDTIVHRTLSDSVSEDRIVKANGGVEIANMELLGDAEVIDSLKNTGEWTAKRDTRISLTFRQAEKVLKGGALGALSNALKR
nr:uncharacterized protein I206_06336 [Kwoniella pini CBS 10737]OCF47435.1 hypothetical protein I206_06336 [Kwoniella pini CBS 10737]